MIKRIQKTLFVFLPFLFSKTAWAGTCALCRQSLSMAGGPGLIQGFYWSIILIAGMPMLIAFIFVTAHRRGMKQLAHKDAASHHSDK
ncbi:MAG: hypothetical protein H6757_02585 [Candidatus Omnitrophica bacterium]|nr:hypothetical protein [Candidatus Omnitrophota bacterium]